MISELTMGLLFDLQPEDMLLCDYWLLLFFSYKLIKTSMWLKQDLFVFFFC